MFSSTVFCLILASCFALYQAQDSAYTNDYRQALIAQGLTPDELALFDMLYVNSARPTLVCLCHHEANVTTCGINGKQYLNECSARCAHVNAACVGDGCGDCEQYITTDPIALTYSTEYNGTVYKSKPPCSDINTGRKLLL